LSFRAWNHEGLAGGKVLVARYLLVVFCGLSSLGQAQNVEMPLIQGVAGEDDESPGKSDPTELSLPLDLPASSIFSAPQAFVSSVVPQGQSLLRLPLRLSRGSSGFTKDGSSLQAGLESEDLVLAPSLSFGLTESITLRASISQSLLSRRSLDGSAYRQGEPYTVAMDDLTTKVASVLQQTGVCASLAACSALVASGFSPLTGFDVDLGFGETLELQPGLPIAQVLDAVALGEAKPPPSSKELGDLEIGLRFEWQRFVPTWLAETHSRLGWRPSPWGLGVDLFTVLPTGQAPTWSRWRGADQSGTVDLGSQVLLDLELERHTALGLAYGVLVEIAPGKRHRPSRLDGAQKIDSSRVRYSRPGMGQFIDLQLSYSLQGLAAALRPWVLSAVYGYDIQRSDTLASSVVRNSSSLQEFGLRAGSHGWIAGWQWGLSAFMIYPGYGSGETRFLAPWTVGSTIEVLSL
jgi:hypothetical protein